MVILSTSSARAEFAGKYQPVQQLRRYESSTQALSGRYFLSAVYILVGKRALPRLKNGPQRPRQLGVSFNASMEKDSC